MFTVFIISFFLNIYIIVFGSKKLKNLLKEKVSMKKYVDEIFKSAAGVIGSRNLSILKGILVVMLLLFLISNVFLFFKLIAAFLIGSWSAKKIYEIPTVSNYTNKMIIYIIRTFRK